jgi:hypothetical protein
MVFITVKKIINLIKAGCWLVKLYRCSGFTKKKAKELVRKRQKKILKMIKRGEQFDNITDSGMLYLINWPIKIHIESYPVTLRFNRYEPIE